MLQKRTGRKPTGERSVLIVCASPQCPCHSHAPQIEKSAAGKIWVVAAVLGVGWECHAEIALGMEDLADRALCVQVLTDLLHEREKACPHRLHNEEVLSAGG